MCMKTGRLVMLLLTAYCLVEAASADAAPVELRSGEHKTAVIELYTSEGCNSCPPADRWLSTLRGDPGLWREFVPLAFHVDYWDYLGWRDRFASAAYSARQRRYALEGGVKVVYTPSVFLDGREWRNWNRTGAPKAQQSAPGTLSVTIDGERVSVAFRPHGEPSEALVAHLAVLGMGLESRVAAGENRGETLTHDFVVLGVANKPLSATGDLSIAEMRLPEASVVTPQQALVSWISTADRQAPIQAVGGFLPPARD